MSNEYEQTQRRFEKIQATFNKLIEQNSYKKLRERIKDLAEENKALRAEIKGLVNIQGAHLRIIKSLEDQVEVKK